MNQLAELELFITVVETGGFSAAARRLSRSPSAVSKTISRMEARLGTLLFERTSRDVKLTPAGRTLHREGLRVIEALTEAENALQTHAGQARGKLRVHCLFTFAKYQLAPAIGGFLAAHPGLSIDFLLSNDPLDMVEHDIDVAIHSGTLPDSSLIARRLLTSRWIVCASPEYLRRHGAPRTPADLAQHNCLNFTHRTHWNTWPFTTEPDGVAAQGNLGADQGDMLMQLALHGAGLVRLAAFHIDGEIAAGRLVPVLESFQPQHEEPLFVVYKSRKFLSPKVRVFLDFLFERFGHDGRFSG
ncbi:LysR family transcriptional regulator [Orrella sp. JC864]|uniref:LysR family transcriptional regulator n=1 Tax=Orrella sp. JC864 TaxID=3120298 RepID=UPI0030087050